MVSPDFNEGEYIRVGTFYLVLDYDASRDLSLIRNWNHVSTATIEENLFGRYLLDDDKTRTWECELVVHPTLERYAFLDPFAPKGDEMAPLTYDGAEHCFYFNLETPGEVNFWDAGGMTQFLVETGYSVPDTSAPAYYNLQGIKVDNPEGGIYIRRQGNRVDKVLVP